MSIELGLNAFQVIQNELISREGTRSTLGLGHRLHALEQHLLNASARSANALLFRPQHSIRPIRALTPEARMRLERERRRLMKRRDAKGRDVVDPTMNMREDEVWSVAPGFPRTVGAFWALRRDPERIRTLLEFYDVTVHWPDGLRTVSIDRDDGCRGIRDNIEACLQELAISWGLDWMRIAGTEPPALITPAIIGGQYNPRASYPPSALG